MLMGGRQCGPLQVYLGPSAPCKRKACFLDMWQGFFNSCWFGRSFIFEALAWDCFSLCSWTIILLGCTRRMKKSWVDFSRYVRCLTCWTRWTGCFSTSVFSSVLSHIGAIWVGSVRKWRQQKVRMHGSEFEYNLVSYFLNGPRKVMWLLEASDSLSGKWAQQRKSPCVVGRALHWRGPGWKSHLAH